MLCCELLGVPDIGTSEEMTDSSFYLITGEGGSANRSSIEISFLNASAKFIVLLLRFGLLLDLNVVFLACTRSDLKPMFVSICIV